MGLKARTMTQRLLVLATATLVWGCRPGMPVGGTTSGDSDIGCAETEISGTCFLAVHLGTEGAVELVADLDQDGEEEVLLEVMGLMVLLDLGQDGSGPVLAETAQGSGWATSADILPAPGVEVVTNASGATSASILSLSGSELVLMHEEESTLGVVGAVEMPGSGGTKIIHGLLALHASSFNGEVWVLEQDFPPPGCGSNNASVQGDYTGDGRNDAVFISALGPCDAVPDLETPAPLLLFSASSDSEVSVSEHPTGPTLDRLSVGDINGDGVDDLLAWRRGHNEAVMLLGAVVDPLSERQELSVPDGEFIGLADFDGDGRDDVLFWQDSQVFALTNGDAEAAISMFASASANLTFLDFNGDGIDDYLPTSGSSLTIHLSQLP